MMTRWKKDEKEFDVSLTKSENKDGSQSRICRVPKPITEFLNDPTSIRFVIEGRKIIVRSGKKNN